VKRLLIAAVVTGVLTLLVGVTALVHTISTAEPAGTYTCHGE
jgi:hypothetical protein